MQSHHLRRAVPAMPSVVAVGVWLARFSGRERRRGAMRDLVELIAYASWICDAPRRRPAASPDEAGLIESGWGVVRPRGLLLG